MSHALHCHKRDVTLSNRDQGTVLCYSVVCAVLARLFYAISAQFEDGIDIEPIVWHPLQALVIGITQLPLNQFQ